MNKWTENFIFVATNTKSCIVMKTVIATTAAPAAIGPYCQAVKVGNMLFTSGQIPIDPATSQYTFDDVVKTTVFLADMSLFAPMNEVYAAQFTGTFPARSAVAVKELPKGALVEIEVIAVK